MISRDLIDMYFVNLEAT